MPGSTRSVHAVHRGGVPLTGFETDDLSMRTHGSEVVRGRWGWSLSAGSLSGALPVEGVAVLLCCTAFGSHVVERGSPKPVGQSVVRAYFDEQVHDETVHSLQSSPA
jgi:hypothetical protein